MKYGLVNALLPEVDQLWSDSYQVGSTEHGYNTS